jgi:hypothetical protein
MSQRFRTLSGFRALIAMFAAASTPRTQILSVLDVHGLVALESGDTIRIVPDENARVGRGR